MTDLFSGHVAGLESPAAHALAVTPDDASDLATVSRALNVGTAGDVQVTMLGGETVTLTLAAGIAFPVRVSRVWATGTTASGIVALF